MILCENCEDRGIVRVGRFVGPCPLCRSGRIISEAEADSTAAAVAIAEPGERVTLDQLKSLL